MMIWGKGLNGQIYKKCVGCGTTERKHFAKGKCRRCYEAGRKEYKKKYWRENYSKNDNFLRKNQLQE